MYGISVMSVKSLMETVESDWGAFAILESVVSAPFYTKVAVWSLFRFWSFSSVICGVWYNFAENQVTSKSGTIDPFGNILFSLLSSILVIFIFMGTWTFTWLEVFIKRVDPFQKMYFGFILVETMNCYAKTSGDS